MYHWYERAAVCYVYLRDVHKRTFETSFPISAWFTRGWTLQELIAPSEVRFYDRDWQYLGDKRSLRSMISLITGISIEVLIGYKRPRECSVAQRMSWAAKRRTTRLEGTYLFYLWLCLPVYITRYYIRYCNLHYLGSKPDTLPTN